MLFVLFFIFIVVFVIMMFIATIVDSRNIKRETERLRIEISKLCIGQVYYYRAKNSVDPFSNPFTVVAIVNQTSEHVQYIDNYNVKHHLSKKAFVGMYKLWDFNYAQEDDLTYEQVTMGREMYEQVRVVLCNEYDIMV